MASHVLGWIGGVCLVAFAGIGFWMGAPVAWTSFRPPTDRERLAFTRRRERVPFGPWCGLGIIGLIAVALAIAIH